MVAPCDVGAWGRLTASLVATFAPPWDPDGMNLERAIGLLITALVVVVLIFVLLRVTGA